MQARAEIDAGVCGFRTTCSASSDDDQHVTLHIKSGCEKIRAFAKTLRGKGAIDAFEEISPAGKGIVLSTARTKLTGCCSGCVVPVGVFKAMQVAAGLALPKDIAIRLAKD